jgi:hypothetical protein
VVDSRLQLNAAGVNYNIAADPLNTLQTPRVEGSQANGGCADVALNDYTRISTQSHDQASIIRALISRACGLNHRRRS